MDSNESAPDNVSSEDDVDLDYDDFYGNNEFCGTVNFEQDDPEYIEYRCLEVSQVKQLLDDAVNRVVFALNISSSLAKLLLCLCKWEEDVLISSYKIDAQKMLRESHVCASSSLARPESTICKVCARWVRECGEMFAGDCDHSFCSSCWLAYFEAQFSNGLSLMISCMENDCPLLCLEDFVLRILNHHEIIQAKYKKLIFKDCVVSNLHLRFCPGQDCTITIFSKCQKAKKVTCSKCQTSFCFRCGIDYHAPTSCEIIRKWLIKCADDSETANYISAHTKDCPNCHTCIEKNGGCNHMQCARCKHHFCWMCFGDWKTHGSEYYECSRYKENPTIAQEANHVKARRALEKYLHYYERYENHHKSLRIEEELRNCIMKKIEEKVNGHEGTWIDWQYLHNAATLLTKCRYTLQYTYPYAYFMESGPRKQLFEYQQAQLEKEIEELSWKVERAESTERGDLESQMHVAECKRRTLLHDFLD